MAWTHVPTETTHPQLSLEKNIGEGFYIFVYPTPDAQNATALVPVSDDLFEAISQFEVACAVASALNPSKGA